MHPLHAFAMHTENRLASCRHLLGAAKRGTLRCLLGQLAVQAPDLLGSCSSPARIVLLGPCDCPLQRRQLILGHQLHTRQNKYYTSSSPSSATSCTPSRCTALANAAQVPGENQACGLLAWPGRHSAIPVLCFSTSADALWLPALWLPAAPTV